LKWCPRRRTSRGTRYFPQHGTDWTNSSGRRSGLIELHVDPAYRAADTPFFYSAKSSGSLRARALQSSSPNHGSNSPAINLYQKLGFKPIGEGRVFRKG